MESEVPPRLPTSGQILGVLIKSMRLNDPKLGSKTAQRFFSGRQRNLVKESSRSEIIEAISDALTELGFEATPRTGKVTSASALAPIVDWHAVHWDRLRTFLLPRMSRVYPSHLAAAWQMYARLAAIDLALRVAAHMHLMGASPALLDFLDWICVNRRGAYLNERRKDAGVSLMKLAESVGVDKNSADGWIYRGVRPSDKNLVKIGRTLASGSDPHDRERVVRDFRRLYWISDVTETIGKYIGAEATADIVAHIHRYSAQAYLTIGDESLAKPSRVDLEELATRGAHAPFAQRLLAVLISHESDDEWKEDLLAAGSDWVRRVLAVNFQVHRSEQDTLILETDGRVLKDWGIDNPKAYEHYQRSMELQVQGRVGEALTEVVKAIELDPLDPANHFTVGSVKGGIGTKKGDQALVEEGMEECWIAIALDPNWIPPWTEIGWLLVETGRPREAVEHLRAVGPECGPLDTRYYAALGVALREVGDFTNSLGAFESSLKLNPNDTSVAVAAAGIALIAGDRLKFNHYRKIARHLGASDELDLHLEAVNRR